MNDWEIEKVTSEFYRINLLKVEDHTSLIQALADVYEAPWEDPIVVNTAATTGIRKLDVMTGGFQNGEVTILAARPSMGKTDMMLHFAKMSGWAGFLPLVFSLEMPQKLITSRLIASTGNFNRRKFGIRKECLIKTNRITGLMPLVNYLKPICKFLMELDKVLPK